MCRLAIPHLNQRIDTISQADAWSLKARRRAGEIVEATDNKPDSTAKAGPGGKFITGGTSQSRRGDVRQELGISKQESTSWQALGKIQKPVFDEFVEKVRVREVSRLSLRLFRVRSCVGGPH